MCALRASWYIKGPQMFFFFSQTSSLGRCYPLPPSLSLSSSTHCPFSYFSSPPCFSALPPFSLQLGLLCLLWPQPVGLASTKIPKANARLARTAPSVVSHFFPSSFGVFRLTRMCLCSEQPPQQWIVQLQPVPRRSNVEFGTFAVSELHARNLQQRSRWYLRHLP